MGYNCAMNRPAAPAGSRGQLAERLADHGVRPTSQRLRIAALLFAKPQHLTAEQLLAALKAQGLHVSKATVYNTLNLFAEHGLLRNMAAGAERTVFDSNVEPHFHLYDTTTGQLIDIPSSEVEFRALPQAPAGMEIIGVDVTIRLRRRAEK